MALVEIRDDTLQRARDAAQAQQTSVEEWLDELVERQTMPLSGSDPLLGLFADAPDIMDDIASETLAARQTQPFRTPPTMSDKS